MFLLPYGRRYLQFTRFPTIRPGAESDDRRNEYLYNTIRNDNSPSSPECLKAHAPWFDIAYDLKEALETGNPGVVTNDFADQVLPAHYVLELQPQTGSEIGTDLERHPTKTGELSGAGETNEKPV